eukprot:1160000-Pelagomonas_calceolata.AAC.4
MLDPLYPMHVAEVKGGAWGMRSLSACLTSVRRRGGEGQQQAAAEAKWAAATGTECHGQEMLNVMSNKRFTSQATGAICHRHAGPGVLRASVGQIGGGNKRPMEFHARASLVRVSTQ